MAWRGKETVTIPNTPGYICFCVYSSSRLLRLSRTNLACKQANLLHVEHGGSQSQSYIARLPGSDASHPSGCVLKRGIFGTLYSRDTLLTITLRQGFMGSLCRKCCHISSLYLYPTKRGVCCLRTALFQRAHRNRSRLGVIWVCTHVKVTLQYFYLFLDA